MTLLQKLSLAVTIGSATFSVAANIPTTAGKTILPDNVVRCEPNAGCINKTLYGRSYKVINTTRFTVMVAISHEGVYTRADVSIANHTDTPLNMSPEDFRVEVLTPKPKVLLYIPPANLVLPPPPLPPAPAPAAAAPAATPHAAALTETATNSAPPTTDVEALYAAAEQKAAQQEAAEKAAAEHHLTATSIPPNEVTQGRVYFERDKKSHLINVVLPIAGLVFEFPYAMKH
jgi:pyruvate/2-oxoglutarate dehydrogenase complex dihydrolipoamide acyltransferase (E2) component